MSYLALPNGVEDPSFRLTERLTALLLDRLPSGIAAQIIELLPEKPSRRLQLAAASEADCSIGFATLIEAAEQILGTEEFTLQERSGRECVECFLWAVAQEFPADLKNLIRDALPTELRSRMNLYLVSSEESRVA